MNKFLAKINNFFTKLTPKMDVFGLEISDGLVRFYDLGGKRRDPRHIILRLQPGAVVGGRVANAEALKATLLEMHKRVIGSPRKSVSVIASIPIDNVYIQPFNLPVLAAENLIESAELNMRMISPIDASNAYYDWQKIGNDGHKDKIDMVGAFAPQDVVNEFVDVVQEAGFSVAAVEFSSLSLIRAAVKREVITKDKPYLLLQIDQGGLSFSVSHMGELYFHYSTDWNRYRGNDKSISREKFEDGVADEVRKLINFYTTNFKSTDIGGMVVVADSFTQEVADAMQKHFKGIPVQQAKFDDLNPAWGAALRGQLSRSKDTAISLSNLSALGFFYKNQLANFIAIWRNIAFTVFGFLLLVFMTSALALQNIATGVVGGDPFSNNNEATLELVQLEQQVEEFNSAVVMIRQLSVDQDDVAPVLDRVDALRGSSISLRRLTIDMNSGSLTIGAIGNSEGEARAFKDRLEQDTFFINVELPLRDFKPRADGTVDFIVNLQLNRDE